MARTPRLTRGPTKIASLLFVKFSEDDNNLTQQDTRTCVSQHGRLLRVESTRLDRNRFSGGGDAQTTFGPKIRGWMP